MWWRCAAAGQHHEEAGIEDDHVLRVVAVWSVEVEELITITAECCRHKGHRPRKLEGRTQVDRTVPSCKGTFAVVQCNGRPARWTAIGRLVSPRELCPQPTFIPSESCSITEDDLLLCVMLELSWLAERVAGYLARHSVQRASGGCGFVCCLDWYSQAIC